MRTTAQKFFFFSKDKNLLTYVSKWFELLLSSQKAQRAVERNLFRKEAKTPGGKKRQVGSMARGHVKWFNDKKGYGFITMENGEDIFVHYTAISGEGYRTLKQGDEVEFEIVHSKKGLQASKVVKIS